MTITRRFSVGIKSPVNTDTAWGIYVPAFGGTSYGCVGRHSGRHRSGSTRGDPTHEHVDVG